MADLTKTVRILFQGSEDITKTINSISRRSKSFGSDLQQIGDPFAAMTKGILAVDAALAALALGGLALAFDKSKDYEQATIELLKVMGEGEGISAELEQEFTQLSRTYGITTTSIISSLAELRQSGFDTKDGMEVLTTSLKLSRASELSVEESTNLLKRSLIGYNLAAKDSVTLGDLWNRTSQVANTNVSKLAEGFAVVSRQALNAGFSLEETAAVLTPIIGVFDSGSEAGIAFSTTLSKLLDPTKEAEAAIRLLTGVSGPLNEEFKTGKDLFEAVAVGLQKVDSQTGAIAVSQIVGVQQAKRVKVAFDDYFKTLDKIGPAAERYKSLQNEVDLQNASATASVDRLKVGFSELATAVGNEFRSAAKEAIDGGTAIENALEDIVSDKTFKPVFDAISKFSTEFGDDLKQIAENLPEAFKDVDFSGLLKAIGDIGSGFSGIFDDIDLTTPEGLSKAIQSVVDTLTSLASTTAGIVEVFTPFAKLIGSIVSEFNEFDDSSKKMAGNILAIGSSLTVLGGIVGVGGILIGGIGTLISTITGGAGLVVALGTLSLALLGPVGVVAGLVLLGTTIATAAWGSKAEAESKAFIAAIEKQMDIIGDLNERLDEIPVDRTSEIFILIEADELEAANNKIDEIIAEERQITIDTEKASEDLDILQAQINGVPEEKITEYLIAIDEGDWAKAFELAESLPDSKDIFVGVEVDTASIEAATEELEYFVDGERFTITVPVEAPDVEKVKEEIEEIPTEKQIEIILQGDIDTEIANIKSKAETVQTAMEWTAKVDMQEAISTAEILTSAFDAAGASVVALSSSTSDMFGSLLDNWDKLSDFDKSVLTRDLEKSQKLQAEALQSQIDMNNAIIKAREATAAARERGDAFIEVTVAPGDLEPALDMIWHNVVTKSQVQLALEGGDPLLDL